jgi:hypothetical protein
MGKNHGSAQNGEVPSAPPATNRQRPEEILAQTLSAAPHPEATEGWSERGRRIFLIAMAAAGVVLVVAGLLVTKQLAPGPGNPAPLESGPGNGLADQLLHNEQPAPPAPATINIPLPTTQTTRPSKGAQSLTPLSPPVLTAPAAPSQSAAATPTTAPPQTQSPSTTLPCGLLGQSLQQAQLPIPCGAATRSTR